MPAYLIASASITPDAANCSGPVSVGTEALSGSTALKARDYFADSFPKFGRMDELSRLAVATAELISLATAGFDGIDRSSLAQVGASMLGCCAADAAFEYSRQQGQPSPARFVYTLPSMFQGEVAIRHQLQGRCTLLSHGRFSALQALVTGVRWIEKDRAPAALVVAADSIDGLGYSAAWLLSGSGEGVNFCDASTQETSGVALAEGSWPHGMAYAERLVFPQSAGHFYSEDSGYGLSVAMR
ncbi:MAG: beta-ketoacyl synthase N-terminal-like domain-containing protein [Planctomycetota bacterium]|jgi:3-oxoacyl-(acyl-carrier-protein) synthase